MTGIQVGIFALYNVGGDLKTALTGGLHLEQAPQGTSEPYGVYRIITDRPDYFFTEMHEIITVQFDIYALSDATRTDIYTKLTALYDDSKLKSMSVTENEIDYTLYYYKNREGTPTVDKGYPTVMDSVYVKYYGQRIVNTDSISESFDSNNGIWFTLNGVIRGWSHGITNFKGGNNITNNGPITYENGVKEFYLYLLV